MARLFTDAQKSILRAQKQVLKDTFDLVQPEPLRCELCGQEADRWEHRTFYCDACFEKGKIHE